MLDYCEIVLIYNCPIGLATHCCVGYSMNTRISYVTYDIVFKCTWGASPNTKYVIPYEALRSDLILSMTVFGLTKDKRFWFLNNLYLIIVPK